MKRFIYAVVAVMLVACSADFEDVKVSNTPTLSDKIINGSTDCNKGTLLVRFTPSAESRLAECVERVHDAEDT